MTKVVNIKNKENYDVYCGRENKYWNLPESIFANPFPITYERTREQAIEEFKKYFLNKVNSDLKFKEEVLKLRGKTLGCWCKNSIMEIPCHCDVIVEYLNQNPPDIIPKLESGVEQIKENKPKKYKIAVIGSRSVQDKKIIFDYLDSKQDKIEMIISGGCSGPDDYSCQWAKEKGFPILIYWPKWRDKDNNYDAGAGFKRNNLIIKACDYCIAFWDMKSRGTANSLEWCKKLNKPVKIIECQITKSTKSKESEI